MARLVKTRTEWEGVVHEKLSVVEDRETRTIGRDVPLRVMGRGVPRVDGRDRVTGRAVYTFDIQLPGMLYARTLRSPHPHARIRHIDVSRAAACSGVRAIISCLNAPPVSWSNGVPLLDRTVRYAGDEVAVVAADNEDIAEESLGLIDVDYEVFPFVTSPEDALRPGALPIHSGGNLAGHPRSYERGDIERGFDEAEIVMEETFRTQPALHNCLESHGVVAAWDGDSLTVWESTQSIYRVQEQLASIFELPENKVRVICQYMGSGFGSKQYTGKWSILAALAAREARRPVRLMLTRQEESLCTGNRIPTVQRLKMGAKPDGTFTAIQLVAMAAIGAYGSSAPYVEGPVQEMYRCPNVRTEMRSVFTNTGPARSFRGPGYVEGAFALESMVDELAFRLDIDPLEIRLRNYAGADAKSRRPFSAKHLDRCYRKGAEMIGWEKDRCPVKVNGDKRRAVGMASQIWGGGGGPPAYAWVRINADGTAEVITGSQDIGTGTRTVFAQIAAEVLGLEPRQVAVRLGDTAAGPYDPVSWGSMTVSSVGPAVQQAALDAREQLNGVVASFLEMPVDKIEVRNGQVYVKGEPEPRMELTDITSQVGHFTILGRGSRGNNNPDVDVRTFGAQFAEVEVDLRTGEVKVIRAVGVHDFGRVINPMGAANQIEGAIVQGIGYGLTEQRIVDAQTGIVLNPNLDDYMAPTALDLQEIAHDFIDEPDDLANSLGAKGIGEPGLIPTAPAIANAIAAATGLRIRSLPVTRAKIIEGLGKQW